MKKTTALAIFFLIAFSVAYPLYVTSIYARYNVIRDEDPLALVHLTFPAFNILIVVYVIIGLLICSKTQNKIIHIWMLLLLGIMLLWTPYLLSGFSRYADSIWHTGMSADIPELMGTKHVALGSTFDSYSQYATSYPGSFILNFVFMTVCGVNISTYNTILYPLLSISLVTFFWYTFLSKVTKRPSVAFLGTALSILGVYYVELYPSPHSLGIILVLITFILFIRNGRIDKFLFILSSTVLVISHPITPLILVLFMIVFSVINKLFRANRTFTKIELIRDSARAIRDSIFNFGVVCVVFEYVGWSFFKAETITGKSIISAIATLFSFGNSLTETASPVQNIFPAFSLLRTISLLSFIIVGGCFAAWFLYKRTKWRNQQLALLAMAVFSLVFSLVLGLSIGAQMRERALFFFGLMISGFIAFSLYLLESNSRVHRIAKAIVLLWIVLLAFAYPTLAYYSEATNSIPQSEAKAMEFLGSNVNLDGKGVSMSPSYADYELTPFINISVNMIEEPFPPNINNSHIDVVLFRKSIYFSISMKTDLSFTNNSYIAACDLWTNSTAFDKVYDNPTSQLFIRIHS